MDPKHLGKQIMSLADLMDAVNMKAAVVAPRTVAWAKPRPAGFLINMPGVYLFDLIYRRELYTYVPQTIKPKRNNHWTAHLPVKKEN